MSHINGRAIDRTASTAQGTSLPRSRVMPVGGRAQPSWIQVVFTWVNLSKAWSDLSRPMPDCL